MAAPSSAAAWSTDVQARYDDGRDHFRHAAGCGDACRLILELDLETLGDNLVHVAPGGHTLAARIGQTLRQTASPAAWLDHPYVGPLLLAVKAFHTATACA